MFLPIISQHTQARGEGYFRLEWKLAAERTHLMAQFDLDGVRTVFLESYATLPPRSIDSAGLGDRYTVALW